MRVPAAAFLIAGLVTPGAVSAQESKNFKDWTIGCDNLRGCIALGFPTEDGVGAYVKVARSGDGSAEPEVDFVLYTENTPPANAKLLVALNNPSLGGLPKDPLPAIVDDSEFLRAKLTGKAARDFLAAAQKGTSLTIALAGDGADSPAKVSLSGASAAFLFMDDQQKRVGTDSALIRPGTVDSQSIPPAPAAPIVPAATLRDLSEKLPPLPPGLAKPADDTGCSADSIMAVRLSGVLTLWGVCDSAGAYNYNYVFSLVEDGKSKPATFELPKALGETVEGLTNPYISEDGRTISEFDKGRGLGDCGVLASWAWDGKAFRLVSYQSMDNCMGVISDDWPVLFRARIE